MKNNDEKTRLGVITNEDTMKYILENGCLGCNSKDSETDLNKFKFEDAIICSECGSIYVPENSPKLIAMLLRKGLPIEWKTLPGTSVLLDDDMDISYPAPVIGKSRRLSRIPTPHSRR